MTSSAIILEYIWIDGNSKLRSKYKTIYPIDNDFDISTWNYDGSSTGEATTSNSEVILYPVKSYPNPFFPKDTSFLILCDTSSSTNRKKALELFNKTKSKDLKPWFGIEQEYFITNKYGLPFAFINKEDKPEPQGKYYCGVGIDFRKLAETHYMFCIKAGLKISGINAEVAPSQWEFQIGPCEGIDAGDELWIARYILQRVAESFDVFISFLPKPLDNPWNGSGLHTNVSTKDTRNENGLEIIKTYMEKLKPLHTEHLLYYGDNSKRLCGECETSNATEFTVGYGNRGCSIRIPNSVLNDKKGYFEDRRPASDADPYNVTFILMQTITDTN